MKTYSTCLDVAYPLRTRLRVTVPRSVWVPSLLDNQEFLRAVNKALLSGGGTYDLPDNRGKFTVQVKRKMFIGTIEKLRLASPKLPPPKKTTQVSSSHERRAA